MDAKKYFERVNVALRSRLGLPNPWSTRSLLGRPVTVRVGTLGDPNLPDYDDAWIHACAKHAEVVFDVGANVGQSALLMLLSKNLREIVLVEANWKALAIAAENLIRNQLGPKCRFVCSFAGEEDQQEVTLWTVGTGAAGSMYKGHADTAASAGTKIVVPTTTLDSLCDTFHVDPDLVKVDVEGAEINVLRGAQRLATKAKTRFLVEMHSPPELPMAENASLVLEWAASLDYSVWYLDKATKLVEPQQLASRGRCHVLLQPRSWPFPDWLAEIRQSTRLPT